MSSLIKELSIVYQNAAYTIRYEIKHSKRHVLVKGHSTLINNTAFTVFFDDAHLKEQFGDPFEFNTTTCPNLYILLSGNSAAWHMADTIIKAIDNEYLG